MRYLAPALCAGALLMWSAAVAQEAGDAARAERLEELMPGPDRLPGAQVLLEPAVFPREKLADHINGEAEAFYPHGVDNTITALLKIGEARLKVDIFDMTSPLGAYGVFSTHRPPEPVSADVGLLSFLTDGSLVFIAGDYYVDITVQGRPTAAEEQMRAIAQAIVEPIGDLGALPPELELFPAEGRVEDSDKFIPIGHLGIEQVPQAFVVEYELDEETMRASVSRFEDEKKAADVFDGIVTYVKERGEEPSEGGLAGRPLVEGALKYRGAFAASWVGDYCCTVCGGEEPQRVRDLLGELLKAVEGADGG